MKYEEVFSMSSNLEEAVMVKGRGLYSPIMLMGEEVSLLYAIEAKDSLASLFMVTSGMLFEIDSAGHFIGGRLKECTLPMAMARNHNYGIYVKELDNNARLEVLSEVGMKPEVLQGALWEVANWVGRLPLKASGMLDKKEPKKPFTIL